MPPVRIGTRKRVAKVFGDFVDASFSESEPPNLHTIPSPPNVNKSIHGHQGSGRPPKSAKKSNVIQTSQELCNAGTRKDSGNTPVFRHTQQTSQDTAIWSFSDRGHSTLGDEELLPMGPRATQYHGTSNETTMSYDQNSEPELAECHAPDNQLGLNYFRQQSSQHQQPHIQPGPSTEMNFRQQSNGHGGRGGGTLQQQLNLPGPSSGKNLRQLQDTNFFDAAETQAFPAEACNGNKRPQLSQQPRHTASEVSTQDSFVGRSSNKEILRQPRNLNEIPNAVFQDYVKRSLEFLKIHCREMSAKIDDLLESRPKPCICTIQRMEDNEEQFNLPMESFAAVEDMEKTMGDQQTRQQMILILLRLGGVSLQKTVYSIMEKLFTCEIGMHYTWTGKSTKEFEKEKFSDLKNIYAAICGAVLGNKDLSSDEKTSVKIQFQVTEWLRHCRQNVIKRRISF